MDFVINEWFLDWHAPNATLEEKTTVQTFFKKLLQSGHRLVILQNSPFMIKLHRYRQAYDYDLFCRQNMKLFFSAILQNTQKCIILNQPPNLAPSLETKLEIGNFSSDRYLFQSAQTTQQKIIVTTDQRLIEHIGTNEGFALLGVDSFQRVYFT